MKTRNLFNVGMLSIGILISSCGESKNQETETLVEEVQAETVVNHEVNLEESKVNWSGSVLGMHSHQGYVTLKSGELQMAGEKVVGGTFNIDMSSISPTDENYSEDKPASALVGHLSSADFFDVKNYPTAQFIITESAGNELKGNLTIRGNQNLAIIKDVVIIEENGEKIATGKITIDRQQYGVSFSHPAKEVVLSDDIELDIKLVVKG